MQLWVYDILLLISWIFYAVAITSLLVLKSKSLVGSTLLLLIFLAIGLIVDITNILLIENGIGTNVPVILYPILIAPVLSGIYSRELQIPFIKPVLLILTGGFLVVAIVDFIRTFDLIMINNFYIYVEITILILSIVYFFVEFVRMKIPDLTKHFFFWINSALMIYFGSSFFLFLFESIIRSDDYLFNYTWPIQLISTIIMNLVIIVGTWKTRQV